MTQSIATDNLEEGAELISNSTTEFLTFVSDQLTFGVNTDHVIEIITNYMIRPVPMVPGFIMGIINLRGQILPIIDMRLRMGKPSIEYTSKTCIIILEIDSNSVGVVVDSVSQVINIDVSKASAIPIENRQELTNSMISLADGTVVLMLDCDAILRG